MVLSTWTTELLFTPEIIAVLPSSAFDTEKIEHASNPIPYLILPTFLANLKPPNKQPSCVKSELKSLDHVSNL